MVVFIILAVSAILIGYLAVASVKARLVLSEREKTITAAYAVLSFQADIMGRFGRVLIAGIPIHKFKIEGGKIEKAVMKAVTEKLAKEKRLRLSDLKIEHLRAAGRFIGHVRIKELLIKISGGLIEPFYTGKMFAYYCAARGIYPILMSHVHFRPDFSSEKLKFEGKGLASIRMFYIFKVGLGLLADRVKDKSKELFIIRKKGSIHG
jgi:hypothetical protein